MKRKSLFIILLIILSLYIPTINVSADSTEQSDLDITFEAYGGAIDPLDPDNPNVLLLPTGQGTGALGPLCIDYVPTLSLGSSHQISAFEQAYPVTSDRPFIQTTDLRGTGSGWTIRVAVSEFTALDSATLPGTSIVFALGTVISPNMSVQAPSVQSSVTAYAGGTPATLITAGSGSGKGTWLARWYDVSDNPQVGTIEVVIPGGVAHVGTYTATIHWQLMDVV